MTLADTQSHLVQKLLDNAQSEETITPENVYQIGNNVNREIIKTLIDQLMLPGSTINGFENMQELYKRSKNGESCLLLVEHYSNFDIPAIYQVLEQEKELGKEIADSIISIAGMKLSVDNPVVSAFAEAYTRIVIYPSRSLKQFEGTAEYDDEQKLSSTINRAALYSMIKAKHHGHIILVFPAGTRYRENDPSTKRGLPEMDSYLKSFDHVLFLGIAGNLLKVTEEMHNDKLNPDVVVLQASPVLKAKAFRSNARETAEKNGASDVKQAAADAIMAKLEEMHNLAEKTRQEILQKMA